MTLHAAMGGEVWCPCLESADAWRFRLAAERSRTSHHSGSRRDSALSLGSQALVGCHCAVHVSAVVAHRYRISPVGGSTLCGSVDGRFHRTRRRWQHSFKVRGSQPAFVACLGASALWVHYFQFFTGGRSAIRRKASTSSCSLPSSSSVTFLVV
jgi:hypothetical protein